MTQPDSLPQNQKVCEQQMIDLDEETLEDLERKYALLEPLASDYLSPEEKKRHRERVLFELRISKRTLRRYLGAMKQGGMDALSPKIRSDRGKPRKVSDDLVGEAIRLLEENPFRSVDKVLSMLGANEKTSGAAAGVSSSGLYHRIVDAGFSFKKKRSSAGGKVFHQFAAEYAGKLWQSDARFGIYLPDGKGRMHRTGLFTFIDDYSRKALYARYYFDEKLPRLEDCLRQSVLRWGLSERLYCDNGSVYISKRFGYICSKLGINKIHHPPYCAWCKGKVERFMRTVKNFQREAALAGMTTIDELNSALEAWLEIEYNSKIHSETGQPPNQRYLESLTHHPPRRVTDLTAFNRFFEWRENRVVSSYGRVSLYANEYRVHQAAPGAKVSVRFDPFDLKVVHIHDEKTGAYLESTEAGKLAQPFVQDIPCERQDTPAKVSKSSQDYFTRLRDVHMKLRTENAERSPFYQKLKEKNP